MLWPQVLWPSLDWQYKLFWTVSNLHCWNDMKLAAAKNPDSLCSKNSEIGEMARPLWKNVNLLLFRSSNDPTISPAFHLKVECESTSFKSATSNDVPLMCNVTLIKEKISCDISPEIYKKVSWIPINLVSDGFAASVVPHKLPAPVKGDRVLVVANAVAVVVQELGLLGRPTDLHDSLRHHFQLVVPHAGVNLDEKCLELSLSVFDYFDFYWIFDPFYFASSGIIRIVWNKYRKVICKS